MRFKRLLFVLMPLAALGAAAVYSDPLTRLAVSPSIGAGYAAQIACAGIFVMGRSADDVLRQDIATADPLLANVSLAVDRDAGRVSATAFHLVTRVAVARPGLGCTLMSGEDAAVLRAQAAGIAAIPKPSRPQPWPLGDAVDLSTLPAGVDGAALAAAFDHGFAETAPAGRLDTRALILAQHGRILAERYAPGFHQDMPMLGWSMSKTATAALVGMMVADGKLALDAPAPLPALRAGQDGRASITLAQLLHMRSGLAFTRSYGPGDDSTQMLFRQADMAEYAATRSLVHPPGSFWSYSTGTTNMLARLVFDAAGGTLAQSTQFMRDRLFLPAGMTSAVWEVDATGSFTGGSYLYMTARDWARLGQLYLNDGQINGTRVLPQGWVAYARKSAGAIPGGGGYGAQLWLNRDDAAPARLRWPHLPADSYAALGHNGQMVMIIPSRDVVVVRLGWATGGAMLDADALVAPMLAALGG